MKHDNDINNEMYSRRDFINGVGAAFTAFSIVPSHVLGRAGRVPPSESIQVAGVGIGGVGSGQIRSISHQANTKIIALCDVDDVYAKKTYSNFPQARRYRDFRKMLEAEDDKIDAVYCGTPDHTHTVISLAAIKKLSSVFSIMIRCFDQRVRPSPIPTAASTT